MHPILLQCGPFTLYSYGLMVALGFAVSIFLIQRNARRFGLDRGAAFDLAILALLGGIVGARLLYIALHLMHYLKSQTPPP